MKKRFILILIVSVVLLIIFLELSLDVKEKFRLKEVELSLFQIVSIDTSENCYTLKAKIDKKMMPLGGYLIGLRLRTEFISQRKEGIKLLFNQISPGDKGHIDTINRIYVQNMTTGTDLTHLLLKPADLKFVKILDTIITGNQISDMNDCLVISKSSSLSEIIKNYNSSTFKTPELNNFYMFLIDSSSYMLLKGLDIKTEIGYNER